MTTHGFVRVACAVPHLRVADCEFNVGRMLGLIDRAEESHVDLLVFPELCLTGYTCGDLFQQQTLQQAAGNALLDLARESAKRFSGLAIVGLPLVVEDRLYNCAAVVHRGRVLGVVPKSYLPSYKEFYETRWFAPGTEAHRSTIDLGGDVPFGTDLLFNAGEGFPGFVVGIEICEDLWVPVSPSSLLALAGATVLVNPSASNEVIGKPPFRRALVTNQSAKCIAGYAYVSAGPTESTTDLVFSGHCILAENGNILVESERFLADETLVMSDVDVDRLRNDRQKNGSFGANQGIYGSVTWRRQIFTWQGPQEGRRLIREIDAHPFVPRGQEQLRQRCEDIFHAQVVGLAKRLEHAGTTTCALGVSGGLDSTLALLVACKTLDRLGMPRSNLRGLTMPGFGTTRRTRLNAVDMMRHLGVTANEIDIRALCLEEMRALGHRPFGIALEGLDVDGLTQKLQAIPAERRHDVRFENIQARMRTTLLMNTGFVIGTGDLSELALGWCTYNADHMSMYNPNVSIPKTLVKFLVRWAAENEFEGEVRRTLLDIVATKISPELLPIAQDGEAVQVTEDFIGPYELHDFFLFHFLRYGAPPEKILYLADHASFDTPYTEEAMRRWLRLFFERFFANQFKRSCLPDGPKVGTISLSPRGDWRMPSDAAASEWLKEPRTK